MRKINVAEPPLFWAAPAPGHQGPGADSGSGSNLLGSAPAPGKKRRLQAAQTPTNKKIGSRSGAALKVVAPGGSGSTTL